MTYSAVYCALISKRLQDPLDRECCYVEKHHIIPKAEGGSDEPYNLVNLTAREHYIAHLLLAKIYNDQSMWCAVQMMRNGNNRGLRKFKFNSRLYELARVKRNVIVSQSMKGKPHLWQHGKKRSLETRKRQSLALKGKPHPWQIGRKLSEKAKQNLDKHRLGNRNVRGKKWWNNGVDERRDFDCPGEGWKLGRIGGFRSYERTSEWRAIHSATLKGRRWYNNGEVNILSNECPIGFVEGRIMKNG